MSAKLKIAYANGDGIGPEIMEATRLILEKSGASIEWKEVLIGEKVFAKGIKTGIDPSAWEIIFSSDAFLKAPITTPQGGGFKSLNVTFRSRLGLFANIRPCRAFSPFVATKHPKMDLIVIRENEEDLYCGIEYQSHPDVATSLKTITTARSERIIDYAFRYALSHGRKKVSCFTKDNIMKRSDGLFHAVFEKIAANYPQIESEHWIVDIGSAKLADHPENFDVIVLENLYGDILSDVTAQIAGSVGLAGSMNVGGKVSMFEAIHGSAPKRAGQNIANPSALLWAAIYMLDHLGEGAIAETIANAWLYTMEEGVHTYDVFTEGQSKKKVGTLEFAEVISSNLGKIPKFLTKASFGKAHSHKEYEHTQTKSSKTLVGIDLFFIDETASIEKLVDRWKNYSDESFTLKAISNQGSLVYPKETETSVTTPEWRARFLSKKKLSPSDYFAFAKQLSTNEQICALYLLFNHDEKPGFSEI